MRKRVQDSYLVKCFLVVFLCFVVDSTIHYFLPYNFTKTGITITPYLGLMMFALLVRTIDGAERYFFATICGLYYSVVYANSLAIYILIYCLIAFVRSYLFKLDTLNIVESTIFCVLTIFAQDCILVDVDYQYDKISNSFICSYAIITNTTFECCFISYHLLDLQ